MEESQTNASDGSVQEIAVNHENPISTAPWRFTKSRHGLADHSEPFEGIPISVLGPPTVEVDQWEAVDEHEAPFTKQGTNRLGALQASDKIVKLALDKLLPHPLNKKLFGTTSPEEIKILAEGIAETGQLSPLIVTADLEKVDRYTLLSGHKRAEALRLLGRTEANCQVVDVKDADERRLRLVEANQHHNPTTEQKILIAEVYFELETKKAKARQVAGAKAAKKGGEVVEVLTQPDPKPSKAADDATGKSRDLAAAKVGMSGVSFERGRKVLKAADKAEQNEKRETAAELRRTLNKSGVDPAYSQAKALGLIEQTKKKNGEGQKTTNAAAPENIADVPPTLLPHLIEQKTKKDVPQPELLPIVDGPAETIVERKAGSSQAPTLPAATKDTDDPLPVVGIIAACHKLADDLEELDPAELTNDQKWNLTRAFDNVSEWFGNHEQALKQPGQL